MSIPTSILTGFLGSGKTTVLTRLLRRPELARTAVLVNEFGEVGIDDVLLRQVTPNVVLLESGCICCTVGDDLTRSLLELLGQREAGVIPPFDRAIIETTGLADPAPVLHHFMTKPLLGGPFRLAGVVTTVDALNGATQLDEHMESVKQAAVADRLLITKTDMVERGAIEDLLSRLREINPSAPLYEIAHGDIESEKILDAGLWNPHTQSIDVERWLNDRALGAREYKRNPSRGRFVSLAEASRLHDDRIDTFCIVWDAPVRLQAFTDAIETLVARHGRNVLRIKGILNVEGSAAPLVVHGVQSIFHPPVQLPAWPTDDHRTRLVFITRDLTRGEVEADLAPANPGYTAAATH